MTLRVTKKLDGQISKRENLGKDFTINYIISVDRQDWAYVADEAIWFVPTAEYWDLNFELWI